MVYTPNMLLLPMQSSLHARRMTQDYVDFIGALWDTCTYKAHIVLHSAQGALGVEAHPSSAAWQPSSMDWYTARSLSSLTGASMWPQASFRNSASSRKLSCPAALYRNEM